MFPGVSTEDIGVWPADDGERVVSVFAERLQRIENAAEPIRAASAAGSEVAGLPDVAECPQEPAVAAQFDPEETPSRPVHCAAA